MKASANLIQHPARNKLEAMSKIAPGIWSSFERSAYKPATAQEYVGKREANNAILESFGEAILARAQATMTIPQFQNMLTTFHTLATWRISQGIYRFDPDVYASVIDSALECEIPSDLLMRLPERSVFVETPDLIFTFTNGVQTPIEGVWARIESITGTDEHFLVLQPLLQSETQDRFLHAVRMPIAGRIDQLDNSTLENTASIHALSGRAVNKDEIRQAQRRVDVWSRPVLNLLLYLAAENSEIGNDGERPVIPMPKMTKKGPRHFPPSLPKRWDVGVRLGAALRNARQTATSASNGSMSQKRAHIRRAHWHGVRVGPTKRPDGELIPTNERRFELRWVPPIFVKVQSVDDLPATIRPVD